MRTRGGTDRVRRATLNAGALTMVSLCFANGLQGGENQTFAQTLDHLKHSFHVNDAVLGIVPFGMAVIGNLGAVPIARLCAHHPRTRVLAAMFFAWSWLMLATALVPSFRVMSFAAGFALFGLVRLVTSVTEATDPAALPLISDYWPVDARAGKISIFNAGAAIGAFWGIVSGGIISDHFGWRWAFASWLPIGLIGAALMWSRREPTTGLQDAAYEERLAEQVGRDEIQAVEELVEGELAVEELAQASATPVRDRWEIVRTLVRLRSWRLAALGIALGMIMLNGLQTWGVTYFKRTFGLSGTQVAGLLPVIGLATFAGILGGGFITDHFLRRGVLRARVYVSAAAYVLGGGVLILAYTTTVLWLASLLVAAGSLCVAIPIGPVFALLMDVTPAHLRSQASAGTNVLQAGSAIGALLVGVLSTLFGGNVRLALMCVSPAYIVGGLLIWASRRTYVSDQELVVADARARTQEVGPP